MIHFKKIKVWLCVLMIISLCGCKENNNSRMGCKINQLDCKVSNELYSKVLPTSFDYIESLMDNKERLIVLVGKNSCEYCNLFIEIIESERIDGYNKVNYLNVEELSNIEKTKLKELLQTKWGDVNEIVLPLLLKINDSGIIDYIEGVPMYQKIDKEIAEIWLTNALELFFRERG